MPRFAPIAGAGTLPVNPALLALPGSCTGLECCSRLAHLLATSPGLRCVRAYTWFYASSYEIRQLRFLILHQFVRRLPPPTPLFVLLAASVKSDSLFRRGWCPEVEFANK